MTVRLSRLRPEIFSVWRSNPEKVSMPNGESLVQLRDRAWQTILDIEQKHAVDESVVVISHNFAIRSIVGEVLGVPLERPLSKPFQTLLIPLQ